MRQKLKPVATAPVSILPFVMTRDLSPAEFLEGAGIEASGSLHSRGSPRPCQRLHNMHELN